jgi:hypothetical protein
VPEEDMLRFHRFLAETGYSHHSEAGNAAYEMFVGPGFVGPGFVGPAG